ncbi:unnamed protein product [Lactuca virosa]|uniref:SGNH hydrolase-type esterase domain-containing protein n=1 Tax=Lactuca virosa TaxID=75947 RepID=A0AAU9N4K2_9ASTR|nr:unnamed protein product [Lactuca virosa]
MEAMEVWLAAAIVVCAIGVFGGRWRERQTINGEKGGKEERQIDTRKSEQWGYLRATLAMTARPQFALFGSSIVQFGFFQEGWAADLAHTYARKADIFMRGYSGWNSRQALQVVDKVFPMDDAVKPSLVIVYFGGNDSVLPDPEGLSSHVPLNEYVENMRNIATHLQSLSDTTRLIFLTAPPVNEEQMKDDLGIVNRKNEQCKIYSNACLALCNEMNFKAIDLFTLIQQRPDWLTTSFIDGIHFTAAASATVANEIRLTISQADWTPSLHWESMPDEFDISISPSAVG